MTFHLENPRRTVIVTGGSAGIGRAIALRFAAAGDRLGLIARDKTALDEVKQEIERAGGDCVVVAADVADPAAVLAATDEIERQFGRVDIWINNAMETVFSTVADMRPEEFKRVTEVTYLGVVHGTMAALKSMRRQDHAHIIQMGSALSYRGIPLQSAYCGAKHAIRGFTESLRSELIHEGSSITVSMIDLPAVNTPQFDWARLHIGHVPRPMGTPIEPEVVADAVFRVAAGRGREYWLGIPTMLTMIANTIMPGFLDRYLAKAAVAGQQSGEVALSGRPDNLERPITALHRTRGSFSAEATSTAILIPGGIARVGIIVAGAALFFALGASIGRRSRKRMS